MKRIFLIIFCFIIQYSLLSANCRDGFTVKKDATQYKGSDYSNIVQVARGISLEEAFDIAENNNDIDYFFYVKGGMMVLEIPSNIAFDPAKDLFGLAQKTTYRYDSGDINFGYCRIFNHGDTIFFKKEGLWLGSAPGLADVYFKDKK